MCFFDKMHVPTNNVYVMNKIIFLIALMGLLNSTNAQINNDSLHINGEIGIRGKWQTGNFAQFVINPNAKITLEKKKTILDVRINYEFLKVNQGSLINDFWSFGMYQYSSNKTIFPIAIAHYGFAKSYAIDQSLIGGIGAGINIIKNDKHNYFQANIFAGYMNLKYENTVAHNTTNAGTYIKLKFPLKEDLVYFVLNINGYISLDDTRFRGFNNRMIVNFQVFKSLGINISYRLVYNNYTPAIINETNGKLVFGINYEFN